MTIYVNTIDKIILGNSYLNTNDALSYRKVNKIIELPNQLILFYCLSNHQ